MCGYIVIFKHPLSGRLVQPFWEWYWKHDVNSHTEGRPLQTHAANCWHHLKTKSLFLALGLELWRTNLFGPIWFLHEGSYKYSFILSTIAHWGSAHAVNNSGPLFTFSGSIGALVSVHVPTQLHRGLARFHEAWPLALGGSCYSHSQVLPSSWLKTQPLSKVHSRKTTGLLTNSLEFSANLFPLSCWYNSIRSFYSVLTSHFHALRFFPGALYGLMVHHRCHGNIEF